MASQKARDLWKQLKDEDRENRYCIECNSANPQWASVSYGTFFCLECSGVHRSLGVHLSFVRSLTMDSWSDRQLAMMRAGGNGKAKAFFKQHGIDGMGIKEKYATKAAAQLREMIAAQVDGRTFEDDKKKASPQSTRPSSTTPKQEHNRPPPDPKLARDELDSWLDEKPQRQGSRSSQSQAKKDEWGRSSPAQRETEREREREKPNHLDVVRNSHHRSNSTGDSYASASSRDSYSSATRRGSDYDIPSSSRTSYSSSNYSGGYNGNNTERLNQFANSRAISSADYFGENEGGSGGSGRSNRSSGYNADSMVDYGIGLLGDGFSKLSTAASMAATKITESGREFSSKVQEKGLMNEVQDLSGKGWDLLNTYFTKAKDTLVSDNSNSGYGGTRGGGYGGGGGGGYNSSSAQSKSFSWEDSRGTDDYSSNNNNNYRDNDDNRRQPPTRNNYNNDRDLLGDDDDDVSDRRQESQQSDDVGWSWDDTPSKKKDDDEAERKTHSRNNSSNNNTNNDGDEWVWKEEGESVANSNKKGAGARKTTTTQKKKVAETSGDGAWDGWE